MDTLLRRPLLAFLASALPALLLVALTSSALPVAAVAAGYGADAPVPFLLLPPDNPWNTRVDALPLDPSSDEHIAPDTALHPEFGKVWGGAPIGIPYVVVPGDQPKVPIDFYYADEIDPGPYPIPPGAPVEGAGSWLDDGDRHVLVLDPDNQLLYEVYDPHKDGDHWHAESSISPAAPCAPTGGRPPARRALRLRADKTFTLSHRFPRARGRSYTVVVTVRDDDGGRGSARFRVTVR